MEASYLVHQQPRGMVADTTQNADDCFNETDMVHGSRQSDVAKVPRTIVRIGTVSCTDTATVHGPHTGVRQTAQLRLSFFIGLASNDFGYGIGFLRGQAAVRSWSKPACQARHLQFRLGPRR